jgi:peptidoglycan/LPS O-acetylase OafA/YrhL
MNRNEKVRGRLLFVDIIRISGLMLVLLHHLMGTKLLPSWINSIAISVDYLPYLFVIDYGRIGVWLFIFASGCSLAVSDTEFSSLSEVKSFYKKRFIRIYPSYWVALLFNLLIFNWLVPTLTITDLVRWFSGFQAFFATTAETWKINVTYWFIGLIISLYLLYPLLLYAVKKHPNTSLVSFFFISLASRYIMYYGYYRYGFQLFGGGWDWFPLCRIFNFALGIYLIRKGLFPKAISNRTITFLSAMSFYVYLLQYPIICATNYDGIGIFFFLAGITVFSLLLYLLDNFVRYLLFKRSMAKKHGMQAIA